MFVIFVCYITRPISRLANVQWLLASLHVGREISGLDGLYRLHFQLFYISICCIKHPYYSGLDLSFYDLSFWT